LSDPTQKVVFHSTPRHSSWLNPIEIWLSLLVRKLLTRGSFVSVEELETNVLAFIAYDHATMAKPFKWTYLGNALSIETTRGFEPPWTSEAAPLSFHAEISRCASANKLAVSPGAICSLAPFAATYHVHRGRSRTKGLLLPGALSVYSSTRVRS
jgi:hypothetical protein